MQTNSLNLLIINYEMDPRSQVLSWQAKLVIKLAAHFKTIIVLTHKLNNINIGDLPSNVRIIQFPLLAKAPFRWGGSEYLLNFWIWALHKRYHFDRCFMHMNYRWAYRFRPFFKLSSVPVIIWYAHSGVTKWLRLATYFANKIVTSTPLGFRITTKKVVCIGQGIDTDLFQLAEPVKKSAKIIYVGRISSVKRILKLVDTLAVLVNEKSQKQFRLTIIGAPLTNDDKSYHLQVSQKISDLDLADHITFTGALLNKNVADCYSDHFLHLSFSNTGSMDKSLMESLSSGCPVLTSNKALFDILDNKYKIINDDPKIVADQIIAIYNDQMQIDRPALRQIVTAGHGFENFVTRLVNEIFNM